MTILKILIVLLMLSGTASASVWVDGREIGLAEYQSSGDVGGFYVQRPDNVPIYDVYRLEATKQQFLATRDVLGNVVIVTRYDIDTYGNIIKIGEHHSGGELNTFQPNQFTKEQVDRYNQFQKSRSDNR